MSNTACIEFQKFTELDSSLEERGETYYGVLVFNDGCQTYLTIGGKSDMESCLGNHKGNMLSRALSLVSEFSNEVSETIIRAAVSFRSGLHVNREYFDADQVDAALE